MRVLIIKTSPLSEIIAALPVLDYLHQALSSIEVHWVVEEEFAEVLEGNPLLHAVLPVKGVEWKKGLLKPQTFREMGALRETLAETSYDFAFDLEGTLKSGMLSRLAGAKDTIGLQREDVRDSGNMLFSMRRVPLRRQDRHIGAKCLRLVSVPFAKDYAALELSSTVATGREDDLAAETLLATLSDGLVFLFDCGADLQTKLWSEQGWVDLAKRLADDYADASILLLWQTEAERALATTVAKAVHGARLLETQTLKGLAALLKRVDLVIGGDTDTIQLAAALGTPTVSFYRSSDGRSCGPRGEQHVVVQSPMHCSRCLRAQCDKDAQCRGTIKVDTMLAGVQSLFTP